MSAIFGCQKVLTLASLRSDLPKMRWNLHLQSPLLNKANVVSMTCCEGQVFYCCSAEIALCAFFDNVIVPVSPAFFLCWYSPGLISGLTKPACLFLIVFTSWWESATSGTSIVHLLLHRVTKYCYTIASEYWIKQPSLCQQLAMHAKGWSNPVTQCVYCTF